MDFILCYEGINREVENLSLVKYELEKRGYSCEIMRFNGPQFGALSKPSNRATVVATPWLRYDVNLYPFLKLAKKPYKIVNLQWEQVYNKRGLESGLCAIGGQSLRACHLCWGENSKKRLMADGVSDENTPIVGAIQMDYNRPIFKTYYRSREDISAEYGLDGKLPWILFVSSFAYTKYTEEDAKKTEDRFGSFYTDFIKLNKDSQKATLEWIEKYLQSHDCEFIYRPHPSESVDASPYLKTLTEKYPHFHIISDYSVKQWSAVTDRVNLWISTSNAEIASMGVNYAIVRPEVIPDEFEVESMVNDHFLSTYEEFEAFNASPEENAEEELKNRLDKLEYFYSYSPDKPAYVRYADALENMYKREAGQTFYFTLSQKLKFGFIAFKRKLLGRFMTTQEKHPEKTTLGMKLVGETRRKNLKVLTDGHKKAMEIENKVYDYLKGVQTQENV